MPPGARTTEAGSARPRFAFPRDRHLDVARFRRAWPYWWSRACLKKRLAWVDSPNRNVPNTPDH